MSHQPSSPLRWGTSRTDPLLGLLPKQSLKAWVANANTSLELKLVQAGDSLLNALVAENGDSGVGVHAGPSRTVPDEIARTFHPEFTYPLFGEEEVLFGYKDPLIKLHFAAGSLMPFLGMKYTYKIESDPEAVANAKRVGGAVPKADDVLTIVAAKLPKGYRDNYQTFMEDVKKDEKGGFRPLGNKIFEYSIPNHKDVAYEVYRATFATPGFKAYNEILQFFLLFFIEGASSIDDEDESWECFLLFQRRPTYGAVGTPKGSTQGAGLAYTLCGFSTAYSFWCFPESRRMRISQFLILPPFQKMGHGSHLYNAMKRDFLIRKEVLEFGVEDPNEAFQIMRDVCDMRGLIEELENSAKLENAKDLGLHVLDRPVQTFGKGSTINLESERSLIAIEAGLLKLSRVQRARCLEMLSMKYLDKSDKESAKDFRLRVKKRLYQRNEEALSGMDPEEMKSKLHETFLNVEDGYKQILSHKTPSDRKAKGNDKPGKADKIEKTEKGPRTPSAYNLFMKTELPDVKAKDPSLSHKDAFKVAANNWKASPLNPANSKK
ncbi:histone acetyltransferase 1 [Entophlyctis luteolus]|nr:histone acetyltransferase 1 [Entophlyctis luteolus]